MFIPLPQLTTEQAREIELEVLIDSGIPTEIAQGLVPQFPIGSPEYAAYGVRLHSALNNGGGWEL